MKQEKPMTNKLSNCMACGGEMELRSQKFTACTGSGCYMHGPLRDPTGSKWNALCADNAMGKAMRGAIPGGMEFNYLHVMTGPTGSKYIHVYLRPIPKPPSTVDVLRAARARLVEHIHPRGIANDADSKVCKMIDAAIAAEEPPISTRAQVAKCQQCPYRYDRSHDEECRVCLEKAKAAIAAEEG